MSEQRLRNPAEIVFHKKIMDEHDRVIDLDVIQNHIQIIDEEEKEAISSGERKLVEWNASQGKSKDLPMEFIEWARSVVPDAFPDVTYSAADELRYGYALDQYGHAVRNEDGKSTNPVDSGFSVGFSEDFVYFDFLELGGESNEIALHSVIDCGSGHFIQDDEYIIVPRSQALVSAYHVVAKAYEWCALNEVHGESEDGDGECLAIQWLRKVAAVSGETLTKGMIKTVQSFEAMLNTGPSDDSSAEGDGGGGERDAQDEVCQITTNSFLIFGMQRC